MTRDEVIQLMESSKTAQEWDANADDVKRRCGGYPDFWHSAIFASGLAQKAADRYGGSADIEITTFRQDSPDSVADGAETD